jgi:mercuric ion binding protein
MLKKIFFILFICMSHTLFAQNKKETVVIQTKTSCNHCKVCETCGGKLETDLYYVRGIKLVTYNEDAMTTTIVYRPKQITPEKIRQEIAKLGFDADNIPADPQGYAKRDGCCKAQ